MATMVCRKRSDGTLAYRVKWVLGGARGGLWQSETFDDRRAALKFQALVEASSHRWPDGWVKGFGFVAAPEDPDAETPFLEFASDYVRRLTSAAPDTQTKYLRQLKALNGWLTQIKRATPTVQNLTGDDDRDWIVARRRAGASPKTIANYHGLFSAVMASAEDKELIRRNPCVGVRLPAVEDDIDNDDDKVFLTEPEFGLVHTAIHKDDQDFLIVAVGTGLRWGELTALKVKDLDLLAATPTLVVRRAWKNNGAGEFALAQHGKFYLGPPKTKESRRRISLSTTVVDALTRAADGRAPDDLIFGAPRGGRLDQGNWYESRWQRAIKKAQDDGLTKTPRFHDLRHTHAAWLISAGVPLPVIQKRLGHKSIQITVDVYGGLLVQTHHIADLAIDRALSGQSVVVVPDDGSRPRYAPDLESAS
jgi:integrase